MKKRVLVVGYFSYLFNESCGQSIKTRNIYALIEKNKENIDDLTYFDTEQFKQSKISVLKMIWEIWHCRKLVYIPAQNNLKYLFPIIYTLCWLKGSKILYFVVGGWLAEYLKSKRLHVAMLSNVQAILTESTSLTNSLIDQYNFANVITIPNFRINSFIPTFGQNHTIFRIVFMARISRMKGLDAIFALAEYLESLKLNKHTIEIDFYGLIESDEEYFRVHIAKYTFVNFKGQLDPDQIYTVLSGYDLMILPTRYYTEGFPGSILDAYISGIPVIVTNWKYATEFVDDGVTGYIIPFENGEKEFIQAVLNLYRDNLTLQKMKINAFNKSKLYSSDNAWKIISRFFD